jgi:hypothetical protein
MVADPSLGPGAFACSATYWQRFRRSHDHRVTDDQTQQLHEQDW